VNNNDFYERRADRVMPDEVPPQSQSDHSTAVLAVHRDPSVPTTPVSNAAKSQRGIAWVRPSELPALIGSTWGRRGIDLQSELVRRSRRAPIKAARAGRRITCAVISPSTTPSTTTTRTEDFGL
jgi:hypothetical protein